MIERGGIDINVKVTSRVARIMERAPASRGLARDLARVYSSFAQERFLTLSRGGHREGSWEKLKPSTLQKRKRRKTRRGSRKMVKVKAGKTGGKGAAILFDTGRLFGALSIGAQGHKAKAIPGGVRFGFSGARHGKEGVTFAELAEIHQAGNAERNLPARPIIVEPDIETSKTLAKVFEAWADKLGQRVGGRVTGV